MSENPSPPPDRREPNSGSGPEAAGSFSLRIENFHYTANELAELRKIAETDPGLAHELVEQKERQQVREDGSFRLGLVCASLLAAVLFIGLCYTIVQLGLWQSIVFVAAMLGLSHMLRAVLTGEWSDTSWFGKMIDGKKSKHDPKED